MNNKEEIERTMEDRVDNERDSRWKRRDYAAGDKSNIGNRSSPNLSSHRPYSIARGL